MRILKLVQTDPKIEVCGLIEEFESQLSKDLRLKRSCYSSGIQKCLSWLVISEELDSEIEIVFDQDGDHLDKIGIHAIFDTDFSVDNLCEKLSEANKDGFQRIFLHRTFKKGE